MPPAVTSVLPELGLVLLLVILNAGFAGTEMALVSLRDGQLQRLERASSTGAVLARLARDPNSFLATIQIGITLAGFLASAAAAVSLAEPLIGPLGFLGGAAEPVAILAVTLGLAYLTLVFGELAPKRVAMQKAERWALVAARPLHLMATGARPVVWLLSKSTNVAVRLLGGNPHLQREDVTEDELRDMVAAQPSFTPKQRLIIDGAIEVSNRRLGEVLLPRRDVFVLSATSTCAEALVDLARSGHSRAPVAHHGDLDNAVGVVHLRDLVGGGDRLTADIVAPPVTLPESMQVLDGLHELQRLRAQLALVVDEHGSAAGVVTVEDLVEELVGEIYDEADPDVAGAQHGSDGSITLPGGFPVHDLIDVGVRDMPEGPFTTVAGLVLHVLHRLPEDGEPPFRLNGWQFEVLGMDRNAIAEVRLTPLESVDSSR